MVEAGHHNCSPHSRVQSSHSGQVTSVSQEKQLQDDAVFSEYSDSDSLESKEEMFPSSDIPELDSDEGFCDNKVYAALS